ncbi:hypothetical protein GCM10020360_18350 [Nonlabens tegetincola]
MPKAKAAPSVAVKVAVWVMKPGPIAEVAIKKIAPSSDARLLLAKPTALLATVPLATVAGPGTETSLAGPCSSCSGECLVLIGEVPFASLRC